MRILIGGIVGVLVLGGGLFYFQSDLDLRGRFESLQVALGITDAFTLGQYYFNHDDEPGGPYDLKKARYYYEKAVAADPTGHVQQWHQLGRIDFLEGDFDTALERFANQQEYFGEELPNTYYMIGLTHAYRAKDSNATSSDWAAAEQGFLDYLYFDETSPWARTDLAWVYFAQGKYEDMLTLLEIGLLHDPENPWLLNMYGLALLNTDQREKAHTYFQWAHAQAQALTVEQWGKAYPGNDPGVWPKGLAEFRFVIEQNLEISKN